LAGTEGVAVTVVDNACPERSFEVVADVPGVQVVHMPRNGGFAYGCNAGWRAGDADTVLFLNPDAQLEPHALRAMADVLSTDPTSAVVGPRTLDEHGSIDWTIRRFPSLRSTYAQALFLHRLTPRSQWVDEVVREPVDYERLHSVDWMSGACLLARRSVLESIGGLDEGFFFYSEDIDLCRRVSDTGGAVVFCPDATCIHEGGRSLPRASLLPLLASSRLRYARRHRGVVGATLERIGIGLGEALRAAVGQGGRSYRRGHLLALGVILRGDDSYRLPELLSPSAREARLPG
jgi:GT2 family glycosyltransferase